MVNPLVGRVGRLHRLAVFEAAARHSSFTAASRELGVTQPGVSRQIRALEQALGEPLFERRANRVLLTAFGRELLDAVHEGFAVIDTVAGRAGHGPRRFVLAANPGLAQRWLVPRLDSLQSAMGDAQVYLRLFDRDQGMTAGGFDAAIHLGRGPWPELSGRDLFPEVTVPVAAPDLARRLGLCAETDPAELLAVDLLDLDDEDRTWMTWADWFDDHGVDAAGRLRNRRPRVSYNNYALVLQDALGGYGVALGWRGLVDELIDRGQLVVVGPDSAARDGSAYRVMWPPATSDDDITHLVDWLGRTISPDQVNDPSIASSHSDQ